MEKRKDMVTALLIDAVLCAGINDAGRATRVLRSLGISPDTAGRVLSGEHERRYAYFYLSGPTGPAPRRRVAESSEPAE